MEHRKLRWSDYSYLLFNWYYALKWFVIFGASLYSSSTFSPTHFHTYRLTRCARWTNSVYPRLSGTPSICVDGQRASSALRHPPVTGTALYPLHGQWPWSVVVDCCFRHSVLCRVVVVVVASVHYCPRYHYPHRLPARRPTHELRWWLVPVTSDVIMDLLIGWWSYDI